MASSLHKPCAPGGTGRDLHPVADGMKSLRGRQVFTNEDVDGGRMKYGRSAILFRNAQENFPNTQSNFT